VDGVERAGETIGEIFVDDGELSVPAVFVVTGELCIRAEVFVAGAAVPALSAGMAEPGDAGAVAGGESDGAGALRVDLADDLVSGDNMGALRWEFSLEDVEVGTADTARLDAERDLARTGDGGGDIGQRQG
jgi:hypothetical protein